MRIADSHNSKSENRTSAMAAAKKTKLENEINARREKTTVKRHDFQSQTERFLFINIKTRLIKLYVLLF